MSEFEFETDEGGAEFALEVLKVLQTRYGYSRGEGLEWINALWGGREILASEGYVMNQGAETMAQMVNTLKLRRGPPRDRSERVRGLASVDELSEQLLRLTVPEKVAALSFLGATSAAALDDELDECGYYEIWNRVLNKLRTARLYLEHEFFDIESKVFHAFDEQPALGSLGAVVSDDVVLLLQGYVLDEKDPFLAGVYRCYVDGVSPLEWETRVSEETLSEAVKTVLCPS